ncbi:MAG: ABC transporter ATP-binding protein [Caldilineaceae bacterium]|nr:ABC transporter ATP-binding protein [Caldilineaceae bacterium]
MPPSNNHTTVHGTGPLARLWHYGSPYRRDIFLATLFSVLNKVFDLAPPALIGAAVDIVVNQQDSILARLGIQDVRNQLIALSLLTAVIWALESLFEYVYRVMWRNLAQTVQHDLRLDAYNHVQHMEMAYFEDRSTGGLMAVLNDDINQLERFLDEGASDIIQLITTIVVIESMFLILAPQIGWLTILPMPFIIWGSLRYQRLLTDRYAGVREQVSVLNSQLANNLGGIATIKSFTTEEYELARVEAASNEYRLRNQDVIKFSSAFVPIIRMLIVIGFIAIMLFGGLMVINGQLNVGVYSVLIFMTQRLLWPLTRLGNTLDQYQRAMASTSRVMDLLDTKAEIVSGPNALHLAAVEGDIGFENVTFEYGGGRNNLATNGAKPRRSVIRNLSLEMPAGETIALVGATGAGKSTIIKLLLRFYDVTGGRILVDGHDLRDLNIADLRRAIGLVSQDVFLFHGTVRENIAYGEKNVSEEAILHAAQVAEAHDFIMQLPDGYETIVGERGQKLSGGQRQRISIARAVLKNPPILILDEATSSVDNETEAAIQRSLERIAVGRTTIVIAHRLSTVRNAHRIYVLEQGELRESGSHEELVGQDGIYASLWSVQTGMQRLVNA